ncbi:hypothetical protein FE848_15605 [Marinobacter sp. 1-3A]|uniref:hypothetical protein n=1 Tax=Marinobacter sp. 1-3A TaxID=2582920 RepID=UPI0019051FD0|nr:hypothetical protein [Marinobacter sp. 1-3A]MBK1874650.1 hypothetical protein [Marinobacter sp. 1-3A]
MKMPSVLAAAILMGGCASTSNLPSTLGESASAYGYIPLDPLAVRTELDSETCKQQPGSTPPNPISILKGLPDISVRFAVASVTANGALSFGPSKVTAKGETYKAVLDYINVDAIPVDFYIRKLVRRENQAVWVGLLTPLDLNQGDIIVTFDARIPDRDSDIESLRTEYIEEKYDLVTIPVYVGLGLRITADIRALKGDVALSSLGAIGAAAQAESLTGTLTLQTLGVTGQAVATALPLPSKLDQTTIENGILSLGSTRSAIYSSGDASENVTKTPRVVGLYSPVGSNPALINAIYSELSRKRPTWIRRCEDS